MNGSQTLSIEVLAQRLSNTDQNVNNLQNQFSSSFSRLESQISMMSDKMSTSGRPNWPVIGSLIGALVVIVGAGWGLGTRPLEAAILRQGADISDVSEGVQRMSEALAGLPQTYLSRQEYADNRLQARQDNENRFRAVGEDIAKVEAETKAAIEANAERVRELADTIVPRGEHEEHWSSQRAQVEAARQERMVQIESLQRQINQVSDSLGGIYGARDVIRDLQARMDRLDALRVGPR